MNQYLLNEEVHVYDFANAEPMICDLFDKVPCCIPRDDFKGPEDDLSEVAKNWIEVWKAQRNREKPEEKAEKIPCPHNFGLVHKGENACMLRNYDAKIDDDRTFTCDGKFLTALMKPLTNNF